MDLLAKSATPASDSAVTVDQFEEALDVGMAAAFGRESTPSGWSHPPKLWDEADQPAISLQSESPEMPSKVDDNYEFHGEIARGGMGVILKGKDPNLGREVAFKVLRSGLADKPSIVQRFVEEAQVGGQLQHPGIVPVYNLGRFRDGRPYFAMKLVQGRNLAEMLEQRKTPSEDFSRFLQIFYQTCQTVAYAHSRGVIHRDLKPSNIMVGAFGEVLVMDWGLAKVLTRDGKQFSQTGKTESLGQESLTLHAGRMETLAGSVLGTPAYMPPEQARGDVDFLDERADVFGLGAILCVILTGEPVYLAKDGTTLLGMAAKGEIQGAEKRLDQCGADPELIKQSKRCLAPARDDRPRHAGEVANALSAYLSATEKRARQAEIAHAEHSVKMLEERKRRRMQTALGLAFTALVVILGVGAWWLDRDAQERNQTRKLAGAKIASEVDALLAQAATAITREELREADLALEQVTQRKDDADWPAELKTRFQDLKRDREMLGKLRDIDDLHWIDPGADELPPTNPTGPQFAAAFWRYGLPKNGDVPAAFLEQIRYSAARVELIAALDRWLAVGTDDPKTLAAILNKLDPNELRDRYRDALVRRDFKELRELIRRPEVTKLPPPFLAAVLPLRNRQVPSAEVRRIFEKAWTENPGEFRFGFLTGALHRDIMDTPYDRWISYLRAAVAARPTNVTAITQLGLTLFENGQYAEAIQILENSIKLDATYVDNGYFLARAYAFQRNAKKAEEVLEATARSDSRPGRAELNRGMVALGLGHRDKSFAHFRKAAAQAPLWPELHMRVGHGFAERGKHDDAIASYREVVKLQPSWPPVYSFIATCDVRNNNLNEALKACDEGLRIAPTAAFLLQWKCFLTLRLGDADAAVAARQTLIAVDPKLRIPASTSPAAIPLADRARILEATKRIYETDPHFVEAYYQAGMLHFLANQHREAYGAFFRAIEAAPESINDHTLDFRIEAARSAAALAFGKRTIPAEERAAWRQKTLDLLGAELIVCRQRLLSHTPAGRSQATLALTRMTTDPTFAAPRTPFVIKIFPANEQLAWKQLWTEVELLREKTSKLAVTKSGD